MIEKIPGFLETLKHEVLNENSSIWDPSLKPPIGIFYHRKRDREINLPNKVNKSAGASTSTGSSAPTTSKKFNEPPNKKYKRDTDVDDLTDEIVLKAIEKINVTNKANISEVCLLLTEYFKIKELLTNVQFLCNV